jgi:hypothetical protein
LSDNRNCHKECLMFDKAVTVKKRPVHSDSTTELNLLYEVQGIKFCRCWVFGEGHCPYISGLIVDARVKNKAALICNCV